MRIDILATESLGVRGLCCLVSIDNRRILIDPGIALGYLRHGQLPHPFQVGVGAMIRSDIISTLESVTDVVISHFHGDHVPLIDANPYQMPMPSVAHLLREPRLWAPSREDLSYVMRQRRDAIERACGARLREVEGTTDGPLCFSTAMPHGEYKNGLGAVMMTRIEESGFVFVHASDIQLLERHPISQIVEWKPDVVLASGPPIYLQQLSESCRKKAWQNALYLANRVPFLVIDHHLLRSQQGIEWLDKLDAETRNRVGCAADFMGERRRFLEAWRRRLYKELPVLQGWHTDYAHGKTDTSNYRRWRDWDLSQICDRRNKQENANNESTDTK